MSYAEGLIGGEVDILKVDVEGAELSVLRGLGDSWDLVKSIIVEVHGEANLALLSNLLDENDFDYKLPQLVGGLGIVKAYRSDHK